MKFSLPRLTPELRWIVGLLAVTIFLLYLGFLTRELWQAPVVQPSVSPSSVNENIESVDRAFPSYVQSGTVEIGDPNNPSTYHLLSYRFGRRIPGERDLQSETGEAYGIYISSGSRLKKIDKIQELRSGDIAYITFYKTPAWSDSGKTGETLLGIIEEITKEEGMVRFTFAADPSNRTFELRKGTQMRTEDPEGLFIFEPDLFEGLKKGTTLRILVDDRGAILQATVLGPEVTVASGRLEHITPLENETELVVSGLSYPFYTNAMTKIVKRGEPNTPKNPQDLQVGMQLHLVYYNDLNRYRVLSLDYEEQ